MNNLLLHCETIYILTVNFVAVMLNELKNCISNSFFFDNCYFNNGEFNEVGGNIKEKI